MKKAWEKRFNELWEDLDNSDGSYYTQRQRIESFISQEITKTEKEMVKELKSWDLGAIPQTDDYANGWNDCRKHFGKGKRRLIDYLERKK